MRIHTISVITYRTSQQSAHSKASARGSLMSSDMTLKSGRGGAGGIGPKGHDVDVETIAIAREIAEERAGGGGRQGRRWVIRERGYAAD